MKFIKKRKYTIGVGLVAILLGILVFALRKTDKTDLSNKLSASTIEETEFNPEVKKASDSDLELSTDEVISSDDLDVDISGLIVDKDYAIGKSEGKLDDLEVETDVELVEESDNDDSFVIDTNGIESPSDYEDDIVVEEETDAVFESKEQEAKENLEKKSNKEELSDRARANMEYLQDMENEAIRMGQDSGAITKKGGVTYDN
jgi:hypothetical protein